MSRAEARTIHAGTAGWTVPRVAGGCFDTDGSHLERYSRVFNGVEINSCFYRAHKASTYAKWRTCTPPAFRFALKVPKTVTHEHGLRNAAQPLAEFLDETAALEEKRGPLLVQLPPSFAFNARIVARFLEMLRGKYPGAVVCEPRHPSWFQARVAELLRDYRIARVAADPAVLPEARMPGGWPELVYFRLHGSPHIYWSRYETRVVEGLARRVQELSAGAEVWCIFDNTATGAAIENALEMRILTTGTTGTIGNERERTGTNGNDRERSGTNNYDDTNLL